MLIRVYITDVEQLEYVRMVRGLAGDCVDESKTRQANRRAKPTIEFRNGSTIEFVD